MSLRFRFAAFYSLLLTVVLAAAGTVLHVGLEQRLLAGMDAGLNDALALARPLVQEEDGKLTLAQEGDLTLRLPPDLTLLIVDQRGRLMDLVGRNPGTTPEAREGCFDAGEWRVCGASVPYGKLLALKPRRGLQESVAGLDRLLLLLFPVTIPVAFGLGYLLSGRALAPLHSMTHQAYALARQRAWQRQLPEPRSRDEVWRLARATNTLLAALAEVIESERRFTQNAAHELRTPLTVLRGRLERALETQDIHQVQEALKATDALLQLVEKLLALARAEAGQGLRLEPVAVDEVVVEVADELRPLFDAKGVALTMDVPETAVMIRGDAAALGMIVRNLLDNALKFTESGRVHVSLKMTGREAEIAVEDTGPGIPPEALPHVFERFFRSGTGLRKPGAGLGLALVLALVRWHGGDVRAENVPGGGARFTVRLPLA